MLVSLEAAAAQPIPALFGIRPDKSASHRQSWRLAGFRRGKGVFRCAPGLNRHVVGNARVLQERRKRIHLGPESYGRRREASAEA